MIEYKTKSHYKRIIRQSMRDLNQVCVKHTELTYRRIYNWLIREGDIDDNEKYYLTNPLDAYEILHTISWPRIGRDYTPHLKQWDQREFMEEVTRATEPGIEAMWRYLDLCDPELMKRSQSEMEEA